MKQVQISYDLFLDLCRYHLGGLDADPEVATRICTGLRDKMSRALAREQYAATLTEKQNNTP